MREIVATPIDMVISTESEIVKNSRDEKAGLPDSLRKQFLVPDEWVKEQEAREMENEVLVAEREEVMRYVILLKKLVVYLAGKTDISTEMLSGTLFEKAELNLPEYLRKEIEVGI